MIALGESETLGRSKRESDANTGQEAALKKIKALLREKDALVSHSEDIEGLSSRGYGVAENEKLALTLCETLFLLSKGIVEVRDEKTGEDVGFQDILKRFQSLDENAWVKYLIYRDLRSRGYVAREGFGLGMDFRIYERGEYGKETAKYLVFGIQEGQPVPVETLAQALKHVHGLKKKLVLAVINRRGEVVYYSLSQMAPK